MVMLFCRTCSFTCFSFVSDKDGHQCNEEGTKDEPKAESEPPKKEKKDKPTEEPKKWVYIKWCLIECNGNVIL